jgi:hypothetical protein
LDKKRSDPYDTSALSEIQRVPTAYAAIAIGSAVKLCDRLFTWPTDQPRHETHSRLSPSKPRRPHDYDIYNTKLKKVNPKHIYKY